MPQTSRTSDNDCDVRYGVDEIPCFAGPRKRADLPASLQTDLAAVWPPSHPSKQGRIRANPGTQHIVDTNWISGRTHERFMRAVSWGAWRMARAARCEVFQPDEDTIVHVVNRTVRRCFLVGDGPVTSKNYDHRKKWLEDPLIRLASCFGIDLVCQAILSNHS